MRAALRARHASVEAEFDDDGDGSLDDAEHEALEEYRRDCVKGDLPMDSREAARASSDGTTSPMSCKTRRRTSAATSTSATRGT